MLPWSDVRILYNRLTENLSTYRYTCELIEMEDYTRKTLAKSEVINATVKLSQDKWDKLKVGESICVHIPDEIAPEGGLSGVKWACPRPNCGWVGRSLNFFFFRKIEEGKVGIGCTLMTKTQTKMDEKKVSVKIKDSCKLIFSADLCETSFSTTTAEEDDGIAFKTFLTPESDSSKHFLFRELIYLEATIKITVKNHSETLVRRQFVQNLTKMRSAESFSDVQVICNGKVFPCHKVVLSTQSPVFKTFLTGDTKENRENRIVIEDSTPNAVDLMLDYLYSGNVRVSSIPQETELRDLIQICDMYEVIELKEACGESIVVNMTEENFFVAFTDIDRYFKETSKFREDAKKFLKSNSKKIAQNKEVWLEFIKKFPELSHEVFMSLA